MVRGRLKGAGIGWDTRVKVRFGLSGGKLRGQGIGIDNFFGQGFGKEGFGARAGGAPGEQRVEAGGFKKRGVLREFCGEGAGWVKGSSPSGNHFTTGGYPPGG